MDANFLDCCRANNNLYRESLDRIIEKYSKFQDLGEEFAVDLSCIHPKILEKQLKRVENTLCDTSLSKSRNDLGETSNICKLSAQDITSGAQLDATLEDGEMYESMSLSHDRADAFEMSGNQTQLSSRSLEDGQKSFADVDLQPEDENEELQLSLSSNGTSLIDFYPSMIHRIERAWHRQHVSFTANAVLKRYRKWRKQLNKSTLNNNSSVVSNISCTDENLKESNKNTVLTSPVIRSAAKKSLFKAVTAIPCKQSPGKQGRPITVIDSDISLNETVSEQSLPDQNTSYIQENDTRSPLKTLKVQLTRLTQSPHNVNKTPVVYVMEQDTKSLFRTKWQFPSLSSPSQHLSESGPSSNLNLSLNETYTVLGQSLSDQNQSYIQDTFKPASPTHAQLMTSISQSPHTMNKTPIVGVMEHDTKSPFRTKWQFPSLSSPSPNLSVSGSSFSPNLSLDETFTVSEQSLFYKNQRYVQDSFKTASPTHAAKASMSPMLKYKRGQFLSQSARDSMCTSDIPSVRQSPLKVQLMTSLSQSPHTMNKTIVDVMEHDTKSPFRTKCQFPSLSSPSQNLSESEPSSTPNLSLTETFTVSEQSLPDQNYIQDSFITASPTHVAKASMSPMLKYKRLQSLSQRAGDSMCTSDIPSVRSSSVRQSPLKVQLMTSISQSPHTRNKTPVVDVMEHDTKSPFRRKLRVSSSSSPSQNLLDSGSSLTPNLSLDETFTVSEQSLPDQNYIQHGFKTASPTHAAKASMSPMLKYKRLQSLSQRARDSMCPSDVPSVRQSPLKVQLMTSISQSPHTMNKTPIVGVMEHDTKSPFRTKWQFPSLSSPSKNLSESGSSLTPNLSLDETFTVSEQSLFYKNQRYVQDSFETASPTHAAKASMNPMLKYKRLQSLSQSARDSMCPSDVPSVRQSPLKVQLMTSLSQSPHTMNKTPVIDVMDHDTKSPFRTKLRVSSSSSPSQNLSESGPSSTPNLSLTETFTVSEQSLQDQNYIQDSFKTASPTHVAKASMSPMLKYKRLQSLSQSEDIPSVRRTSPARLSPLKIPLMSGLSQSPDTYNKTPVIDVTGHDTKSPLRAKWRFSSFSCPSKKLSGPSKIPTPNSQSFFSSQHPRAHSRRHLSFDSTQPSAALSLQVDSEFRRVFHKFVCLNKYSPFKSHACSLCASSNHSSSSSSVLAALALSPHCSKQRKRYRGVELDTDPQSKRFKVKRSMNSPVSKQLRNENLRRCLYPDQPSRFSSDNGKSHDFTTQRFLDHLHLYKKSYE